MTLSSSDINYHYGKGSKKRFGIFQLCQRPPLPPLKLENIQFFFYMTRRVKFSLIFSHICVMKHTISKNQNFQKKILYCVGAGTPRSLATQPTLGGGSCCELEIGQNLILDHNVYYNCYL